MFKIYDGREHFYQWDLDRKLIVEDASVTEVHFCNRTDSCSLVCETYVEDGVTLVNVPNILLQTDWRIHVYAYDETYTKHDECYEVKSRTKPADYVYTETELWTAEKAVEEALEEAKESGAFKGDPGYTPVKGKDYYTEEEKQEIIDEVILSTTGDIETALDGIITIQNELIGGEN